MTLRLLVLLLAVAATSVFGQDDFPGFYGKITSRPKAGDFAPDITFTKVLHNEGAESWSPADFYGKVTVLGFLPYVSDNPALVNQWNALVEQFAEKQVQFAWITREKESTLLPFLQEHPIKGWLFHDPNGGTGRSYGLESPETVIIGADHRIVGFDRDSAFPNERVVNAVLDDRITTTPPKPPPEGLKAFSESRRVLLSPEPQRMPQPGDHKPDFSPSYAVHIALAHDPANGGDYAGGDYWSLQGYTAKRLLAQMLDLNSNRIELPAPIDTNTRYDFAIVLPRPEDEETKRSLIRLGVEDYFHITATSENRLRDVYVLTAPEPKLRAATSDQFASDGSISTIEISGPDGLRVRSPHNIEGITSMMLQDSTVDQFCKMLESDLDRPVVNETKLDGKFDFEVKDPAIPAQQRPKGDFVQRLRDQLGLVIAPAQRYVETTVYRLR